MFYDKAPKNQLEGIKMTEVSIVSKECGMKNHELIYRFNQCRTQVVKIPLISSRVLCFAFFIFLVYSCNGQKKDTPDKPFETGGKTTNQEVFNSFPSVITTPTIEEQISPFIRRIFQDSKGHFWYGTNGDGVVHYDGDSLAYYNVKQGFAGSAVRSILEDKNGNLWFGTEDGLSKYSPNENLKGKKQFKNFRKNDGLVNNDIWSMLIDSNGIIWIGTLQGVSRFDGSHFTYVKLPETEIDATRGVTSTRIVHDIFEDRRGNLWFATNGGVYIYNPHSKEIENHISEENGLCNNVVNDILEDQNCHIWFATHHNGVCRLHMGADGLENMEFTHFGTQNNIDGTEVWSLFEDSSGNIWFPTEGYGVYRYNGKSFDNFSEREGLASKAIQCIYEDRNKTLWFGGHMGLYKYDPSNLSSNNPPIINMTRWQLEHH